MPAHALAPELGWEVIDACAAPGNKTTHVAGNSCSIGHVAHGGCSTLHECIPLVSLLSSGLPWPPLQLRQ